MKVKYVFLSLAIVFVQSVNAQESSQFIGTYIVKISCIDKRDGYLLPAYNDEIVIAPSLVDTFDIQLNVEGHLVGSLVLNDSAFQTPIQKFPFYASSMGIWGNGYVKNDSLYYIYGAGSSNGLFECTCKGINKNATGIHTDNEKNPIILISAQPVGNTLQLDLSKLPFTSKGLFIAIYSTDGTLLAKENSFGADTFSIDISQLPAGIYILRVNNCIDEYSEPFVKE